jgi:small multidrug resistance pump
LSWVYLGLAIAFEVAGTTSMKFSAGLTKVVPSVLMFVFYFIAFSLLSLALKKIEVGMAYAIWSGAGTVLIVAIGAMYFNEMLSVQKIVFIALIVVGVIGLNVSGTSH